MINQEIQQQLKSATSSDHFTQICEQNGLECRGANGAGFTAFAYQKDDWENRVLSPQFCPACGTADLPKTTLQFKTEYCKPCGIKFGEFDDESEQDSSILNDPHLNSVCDVPDHVTRGEMHDDRMAMFRNEY